jgi:hypothetical protein
MASVQIAFWVSLCVGLGWKSLLSTRAATAWTGLTVSTYFATFATDNELMRQLIFYPSVLVYCKFILFLLFCFGVLGSWGKGLLVGDETGDRLRDGKCCITSEAV